MKTVPLAAVPAPEYPARRRPDRSARGWVRGVAAALATAGGLWVSGCDPIALSGDIAAPSFFECSEGPPNTMPMIEAAGTYEGELCGVEKAWAGLDVAEPRRVRLEASVDGQTVVRVIDPEGYEATSLTAAEPSVDLDLTRGSWSLAVESDGDGYGWFSLTLTDLE